MMVLLLDWAGFNHAYRVTNHLSWPGSEQVPRTWDFQC